MDLRVLTLNTWNVEGPWQRRWELILREVEVLKPAVLCFQEIQDENFARRIAEGFHWDHAYSDRRSWLLTLTRGKVIDSDHRPYQTQSPAESYTRGFLATRISWDRQEFVVVNTHLAWRLPEHETRLAQVQELVAYLDRHHKGKPVLVAGDFNAPAGSPPIEWMKEKSRFIDAYAVRHPGELGYTWDNRNPFTASHGYPDRRLDYLFFRDFPLELGLEKADIIFNRADSEGIYPSDHFGLFAEFKCGDGDDRT
ncbi:MAG: endonuclease/exonuclease/phosphatase family protein [Candidatus Omnitrophota bacterium]